MTDLARFDQYGVEDPNGVWVLASSVEKALRQAEQEMSDRWAVWSNKLSRSEYAAGQRNERERWFAVDHEGNPGAGLAGYSVGYEQGQRDERQAQIDREKEIILRIDKEYGNE